MRDAVEYNEFIQPICLPSLAQNTFDIVGTVVGYGFTETPQGRKIETVSKHLEIPTVSQESCLFSHPNFHYIASERTFCGGQRGKIPCEFLIFTKSGDITLIYIITLLSKYCKIR